MFRRNHLGCLIGGIALGGLLTGCGGGGVTSQGIAPPPPAGPVTALTWTPPAAYNDNTVMDPAQDLDFYEIYVRQDPNFADTDLPVAEVASVADVPSQDGQTIVKSLVTEFNLNLLPNLPSGSQLYVSLKAVGVDKQKSAFMTPVVWTRS